ncbi:MAG: chemotaxis protein CheX [Phycisphaerae bacterium]
MTTKSFNLGTAISEVIENLAMMVVQELDENPDGFNPQLMGTIEFTGPVNGKLVVRCSDSFSSVLAGNLLGIDPADQHIQANAWDALEELLNVVCGNLVNVLFDRNKTFRLSSPRIDLIQPLGTNDIDELDQIVYLRLDDEIVEFSLVTKNPG